MKRGIRWILDALLLRGDSASVASVSVRQFLGNGMTTLLDVGLFSFLCYAEITSIMTAAAISYCVGTVATYLVSSAWVFRHLANNILWQKGRFARYVVCALLSLGLSQIIIWLVAIQIGLPPVAAKIAAVLILFFWNQWMAKRVIFNEKFGRRGGAGVDRGTERDGSGESIG